MLRLTAVVVSIGIADSMNPTMILAALYLAGGQRPRGQVLEFTVAVFIVYFLGGVAIALGPGQLALSVLPEPGPVARSVGQLVAGAVLLAAAAFLWFGRERLSERKAPAIDPGGRSSAALGAAMTVVELPTAFPYMGAIGAIVDSGVGPAQQLLLLTVFNACFVLPLLVILALVALAGERAERWLRRARERLARRWPATLALVVLLVSLVVLALGIAGLIA